MCILGGTDNGSSACIPATCIERPGWSSGFLTLTWPKDEGEGRQRECRKRNSCKIHGFLLYFHMQLALSFVQDWNPLNDSVRSCGGNINCRTFFLSSSCAWRSPPSECQPQQGFSTQDACRPSLPCPQTTPALSYCLIPEGAEQIFNKQNI